MKAMSLLQQGIRNPLVRVIGARAVTFPITLLCGLAWIRLVIGDRGASEYAFVALVVGLQFFLGFLDFGTSANVLEAAGGYRAEPDPSRLGRALGDAWRTIIVGNLVILVGAVTLFALGSWGSILGFPARSSESGLAVVLILGINVAVRPLSLSTALVAGLGRPAIATWCQALTGASSLGLLALLLAADAPVALIAATQIAGQLVAYAVPFVISIKLVPGLLKTTLHSLRRRAKGGPKFRQLAVPMLIIQTIGPLNDQLDRLVLSHLSTVEALATYALGAQLASSATSFLTVLTPQLWVEFAEMRIRGGPPAAVLRSFEYIKRFWVVAVLGGASFAAVSHGVAPWISKNTIHLTWALCSVFGASLSVAAVGLVLGLSLTDVRSIRLQPVVLGFTTAINLVLTFSLAEPLGAVGPALSTLVATLVQIPLLLVVARQRLRGPRREGVSSPTSASVDPGSTDSLA